MAEKVEQYLDEIGLNRYHELAKKEFGNSSTPDRSKLVETIGVFQGATSDTPGTEGLVPAP